MSPARRPLRTADTARAQRRLARRGQFLDIAQRAFATHGYHGVTMARVSAAAGVSKPILYHHFSGKLDLYLNVVQRCLDRLTVTVRTALADAHSDFDAVHSTVGALFDLVDQGDSGLHAVIFDAGVPSEPAVHRLVQAAVAECTAAVAQVLHLRGETTWRANLLASWLVGAGLAAAGEWDRAGRSLPKHQAVETLTQLCWAGLQGRVAPAVAVA